MCNSHKHSPYNPGTVKSAEAYSCRLRVFDYGNFEFEEGLLRASKVQSSLGDTPHLPTSRLGIKTTTLAHLEVTKVENIERPIRRTEAYIDGAIERIYSNVVEAPVMRVNTTYAAAYTRTTGW